MRRSVVAFIVSIFLLGGGLLLLNLNRSNSNLPKKEKETSIPSQDQSLQSKKSAPVFSFNNIGQETTAMNTSSVNSTSEKPENTEVKTTETKTTVEKSETAKIQQPISTAPDKQDKPGKTQPKVEVAQPNAGTGENNAGDNGLSPLFYQGLQLDVVGLDLNLGSDLMK